MSRRSLINWPLAIVLVALCVMVWGIVFGYW